MKRLQIMFLWAATLLVSNPVVCAPIAMKSAPLLITAGDPTDARYNAPPSLGFDGVGRMLVDNPSGQALCSASLLTPGLHVLTAAHCVTNAEGMLNAVSSTVMFTSSAGEETIAVSGYSLHPDWTGDYP